MPVRALVVVAIAALLVFGGATPMPAADDDALRPLVVATLRSPLLHDLLVGQPNFAADPCVDLRASPFADPARLIAWGFGDPLATGGEPAWRQRVAAIAATYGWTLDHRGDTWFWSPQLCSAPPVPHARISEAEAGSPHARKVYELYVADARAYALAEREDQPIGQVLVKEAFVPREVPAGEPAPAAGFLAALVAKHDLIPAHVGDRWYVGGDLHALFVMLKVGPADTAGTDAGWIYATVAADRTTITALGRVQSCMQCHDATQRDRVFGSPDIGDAPTARTSAAPPRAPLPPATAGGAGR